MATDDEIKRSTDILYTLLSGTVGNSFEHSPEIYKRASLPKGVPNEENWDDYFDDEEMTFTHAKFFGRSIDEMLWFYKDNPVSVYEYLCNMPEKPFRYYVFGFVEILVSENFFADKTWLGCTDLASCFLALITEKLTKSPSAIMSIMPELLPIAEQVAAAQEQMEAEIRIYGSFRERVETIERLYVAVLAQNERDASK